MPTYIALLRGVNLGPHPGPAKLHVTFVRASRRFRAEDADSAAVGIGQISLLRQNIYLYCPDGYSQTKLTNELFERKLSMRATKRNWKIVNKLYEMAQACR